jgi:hypothetical protein
MIYVQRKAFAGFCEQSGEVSPQSPVLWGVFGTRRAEVGEGAWCRAALKNFRMIADRDTWQRCGFEAPLAGVF